MSMVQQWTGRETRMLRNAMRLTVRDFAAHLGVSERNVSKWEAQGASMVQRPETQQILDTAHARLSDEAQARFALALGVQAATPAARGEFEVESHKFIPIFVGTDAVNALASRR